MKKFAILTSLLALAACGGGSGSGTATISQNDNGTVTIDVNQGDNNNQNTGSDNNNNQGGNTGLTDFINSNLGEKLTDMNFLYPEGTLNLDVQNGRIVSITERYVDEEYGDDTLWMRGNGNTFTAHVYMLDPGILYDAFNPYHSGGYIGLKYWISLDHQSSTDSKAEMVRQNTAAIRAYFEQYPADENTVNNAIAAVTNAINAHAQDIEYVHGDMEMNSIGQSLGLNYSDIGSLHFTYRGIIDGQNMTDDSHSVYVGEYQPNNVEKPTENATFTGTAIAAVNYWNDFDDTDKDMLSTVNSATLTVSSDGTEELSMPFSRATDNPWYDVVIDSNHNINIDVNDTATARITDDDYKITSSQNNIWLSDFDNKYYGENGVASEATNYSSFTVPLAQTGEGITVDTVFGGTRNNN